MGKRFEGGSIGNDRSAHRGDRGWDNPRDDERDPAPRDPDMDRYAIGTNASERDR
jgi:hypothetical protein